MATEFQLIYNSGRKKATYFRKNLDIALKRKNQVNVHATLYAARKENSRLSR